jgi:hypothetical protein
MRGYYLALVGVGEKTHTVDHVFPGWHQPQVTRCQ